jgi:purine-binding chemotaxis protein CheW
MVETAQYLTLGLDGETFGIGIRNVREILDMRPISKIPHAPNFLLGMIDVRGTSFPIVDLRIKLDLPSVPATEATRIIILDVPMGDRFVGVGFVADCVFEVAGIDESQIERPPSGRRTLEVGLSGGYRQEGRRFRHHLRSRQADGVQRRYGKRHPVRRCGLTDAIRRAGIRLTPQRASFSFDRRTGRDRGRDQTPGGKAADARGQAAEAGPYPQLFRR